jgi:integrase
MVEQPKIHQQLASRAVRDIAANLPALPSVIRYYDDFDDQLRSIQNPSIAERFSVHIDGRVVHIDFDTVPEHLAVLLKHVFLHTLGQGLAPSSAAKYTLGGRHLSKKDFIHLLDAGPTGVASFWMALSARRLPVDAYTCAKSILKLLCKYRLKEWSDSYLDVVAALPLPFKDKYAVVRSGEAFLSVDEEASVVRYLDEAAQRSTGSELGDTELQDVAMLLCAYQFGMRPVQIARLTFRDMRIRRQPDDMPSVHLTFRMAKQRSSSATKSLLRRVKREWTAVFVELERRAQVEGLDAGIRMFGVESANEASHRIAVCLQSIMDGDATANTLRHTAAQRLVDAGASQEELAEFLGHTDSSTGLVYYETSANQAERINKALGISEIYKQVARIAHARFINPEELSKLKETQQVGGVPHGVPIAGIGGCTSGQPACPYNPVMSCYGCRKFMPIHNVGVHSKVLNDFRAVARFFHEASRGDAVSPTYLQLERTISEVQAIVNELDGTMS